ncbi:hypothetical protein H5410_045843 [Solanum commersonii]|uniref:NB-ARC domain-containing protein n=1 Tax=Solanum commersonii TaxID=4109 RepID=A0A9J5XAN1_SOLCO|nr:hypothetical protein H5410_045843 [Solanum commersonii]
MRHIQSYVDNAKAKEVGGDSRVKTLLKDIQELAGSLSDQFECFGLVYVSQQPRAGEILLGIAKLGIAKQVGLTKKKRKENLEDNLRSLLKIKRYVILLDDIWDVEIWDDLKLVLPECDSKVGSRIIIMSRNLIQLAKRTYNGRISSCRIHDLLHRLCVDLAKESNFFHTEHNAFGDPGNVARLRRITFYSDNVMDEFFRSNPKLEKLRVLFCFTENPSIFSPMVHFDFKLLQTLVVVMPQNSEAVVTFPSKFGNMTYLCYLRLEGYICGKLPNSIVKLTRLETIDIDQNSMIQLPSGVWEAKQLRHFCYIDNGQASNSCFSTSSFYPNMYSLPPNNLQTLMWISDKFFELRLLHRSINLRKLGIVGVSDSTIKILSTFSLVPKALEVLKLMFFSDPSEQINFSSYPNIVKLHLHVFGSMSLNSEAFPPNLGKLTLVNFMVDRYVLAVLKTLPKLRKLKMVFCKYNEEKMDLSGEVNGYSFLQLEVLHIHYPDGLCK